MDQTRGVNISHGVAFFKRGILKKELEGYDEEKFKKILTEFDSLNPKDPETSQSKDGCTCTVL
ncbi:hypothetical protein IWW40_004271 [Coemansia sp. RSA 1250]|nr:hypothetical protein IWW40_004271 [Coemansia sp. RSA 1250]